MCILKILSINKLMWLLSHIIWLTLLTEQVNGKPQDIFGKIATGAVMAIQQGAEMIGKGGAIIKNHDFEVPFGKVHSETKVGAGEAMLQRQDSESSEEDRRKRSLEDNFYGDILGEESLLPFQHTYFHHILKRSPCHTGTGGGTGAGGGTGTGGGGDLDVAERRRRAYARKLAAAKKKAKASTKRKSKKKYIVNDPEQTLTRRKRQSEQNDLNNGSKDFSQHAQQVATKIRSIWDSIVNSMNQMAQTIREKFSNNSSSQPAVEEI